MSAKACDRAMRYGLLAAMSLAMLLPLAFMLSTSLKSLTEVYRDPPTLLPERWRWENFGEAFTSFPVLRYIGNTLVLTVLRVVGTIASTAVVAWGFARYKGRWNGPLFGLCLSTALLPAQVTAIPVFSLFVKLGFYDTYLPLVLPACLATNVFFIFLLKQFFEQIPEDLLNAARLDGCSEFAVFWRVGLPLCRPILWTIAVFTAIWSWNDYFGPLIYLNDESKYPLSLGLTYFLSSNQDSAYGTQWNLLMAVSLVAMVPTAVLFFLAQRAFVDNAMTGGVKQ